MRNINAATIADGEAGNLELGLEYENFYSRKFHILDAVFYFNRTGPKFNAS